MRAEAVPAFAVAHQYPQGGAPSDEHPPGWGPLVAHRCARFGLVDVVVHSTERRRDGWSYNVAEQRDVPAWVGYYHHAGTGKRLRASNSPNALPLAQVLEAL